MWNLAFYIAPPPKSHTDPVEGSWCVSISLLESSPPTFLDSQILIQVVPEVSPSPIPLPSILLSGSETPTTPIPPTSPLSQLSGAFRPAKSSRADSNISIRLKTSSHEQLEAPGKRTSGNKVMVTLEKSALSAKLQYSNNPYIGSDEKLRGRLEARLGKPEAECIIC